MTTTCQIDEGSSTINTLGTITTGVWSATIISLQRGGTNAALTASNGGIFYSTGSTGAILSGTATASQVLLSGSSTTPAWSTATYPATTTINQLLYSSAANVIGGITTGNNGTLVTSAGGVPSISSTLPSAVQGNITTLGTIGTGVWQGSIIALAYGGTNANLTASNGGIFYSSGTAGAILAGTATANQVLLSGSSTTPTWSTATYPATTTINQILYSSAANVIGGITTANSATLYTTTTGVPTMTAAMTNGQILIGSTSANPVLGTISAGSNITVTNGAGTITIASTASSSTSIGLDAQFLLNQFSP